MAVRRPKVMMAKTYESDPGGECALCLRERRLCDSHIIPEFMYEPGYGEKDGSFRLEMETGRRPLVQKGYTEPLLCEECEGFLNDNYERPFYRGWYELDRLPPISPEAEIILAKGIRYAPFKLFHLSVLWRASVASDSFCKPVDLGPHEEPIREMVLDGDAGEPTEYPIMGAALTHEEELAHGLVMGPAVTKYSAMRLYSMIYGGFEWVIGVASHCPRDVAARALKRDGTMRVLVQEWTDRPVTRKALKRYASHRPDGDL